MPNTPISWDPGSTIRLCRVPWDAAYRDIVQFADQDAMDDYFASLQSPDTIVLQKSTYMPYGEPVTVAVPFSTAYAYNYAVIENPPKPVEGEGPQKTYYYFIVGIDRPNPGSTTLTLQLDVWTSYQFDVDFHFGFLESGHLPMADSPALDDSNVPRALNRYYNQPEDLNTSPEFQTYLTRVYSLQAGPEGAVEDDYVAIVSTANLEEAFGNVTEPNLATATGQVVEGVYSGSNVYLTDRAGFGDLLERLSHYSWVAQCIVSICTVPRALVDAGSLTDANWAGLTGNPYFSWWKPSEMPKAPSQLTAPDGTPAALSFSDVSGAGWTDATSPYSDIRKLWAYPYSVVELTAFDGDPVFLKPQLLPSNETALMVMGIAVMPFSRAAVYADGYASQSGSAAVQTQYQCAYGTALDAVYGTGDFLDSALWVADFPQFSIVNNSYLTYMASNANTIRANYASAAWTLNASGTAARQSWQVSRMSAAMGAANSYLSTGTSTGNALLGLAGGVVTGGISNLGSVAADGGAGAGGASAVAGALGTAVSAGVSAVQTATSYGTANQITSNAKRLSNDVADKNLQLANYINSGTYENTIRSIEAGLQDAELSPPSTVGQTGGSGFRYAQGLQWGVAVRFKRVSEDAIVRAGQFFRRFGVRCHRYVHVPDHLNVCKFYSYYKFGEIYITSARADEAEKDAIRGIFSQGVTVWDDPALIGTVTPDENIVDPDRVGDYYD